MKNTNSFTSAGRPARWAAAMLCAAMLCGCSRDALEPAISAAPEPSGTYAESTPQPGGSLTLPMPENAELGNPLKPATREMRSIYGLIFESLLGTDSTGAPIQFLAENWTGSDDGLEWTFTLRSGVKWQGTGRELNAGDVVFTLDQIKELSQDTTSDYPYDYVVQYLSSWSAVDDKTVRIKLKKPFYGALLALTFPILPSDGGYENGGAPPIPVGTGPYTVTYYEKGKTITMKANPDWWRNPPYISDITVMAFPDNPTEISSLVLRQLDAVQTENLTVTQYRDSGVANLYEYPTRYFEFIALNFTSPDIQDKKIRQAIANAIDRREIVSYTYVNHATVTDTLVQDSWLYDQKALQYNHDVDNARRLIMLAGWQDSDNDGYWDTSPDGVKRQLTFTLLTNMDEGNTLRNDAAVLIKDQLDKAGIKVVLKSEPWSDYTVALRQKNFDLALCGCYMSPVPDYSSLIGSGGSLNVGGFKSDSIDALLDGVMCASDSNTLKIKMGELQAAVVDELPIISLYFRTHSLLTSPNIKGVSGAREDSAYAQISQWYIGS